VIHYQSMSPGQLLALAPPGWGGALLSGLGVSLLVAGLGYLLGLLIGLGGAQLRRSRSLLGQDLVTLYTTLVRAVPELVLILLVYFALPQALNSLLGWLGLGKLAINGLVAGVLVIAFVQGAYATEVILGAMNVVPLGQLEAAHSFGMRPWQVFRRILLPAMLPGALPGLSNLWLIATKDTALLAVVGFAELTLVARQAAGATKHYFLFLMAAGVLYLLVSLLSHWLFGWLERRLGPGRAHA